MCVITVATWHNFHYFSSSADATVGMILNKIVARSPRPKVSHYTFKSELILDLIKHKSMV